jgi:DNA invertase Pin-like site-specific DNA recombinase
MTKYFAVYERVSSRSQTAQSQTPDLKRWADAQDGPVRYYSDVFTGKTMERPGWKDLEADFRAGLISQIVVWRLDRLGRTAKGLTALFEELQERKIGLVSIKEGIDLSTPGGRLMANVIASMAQYETEVRGERVLAGQLAARAQGKKWGGSQAGVRKVVTPTQERAIHAMYAEGETITNITRAVKLSRPTIYSVLRAEVPVG